MNSLVTIDNVTKDSEVFMNEIISTKGNNLPTKLEDVLNVFEFTDFKAKAWKILVNKMCKLEEQTELYQSALRSGQQWGIASLYAQKRMGEITRDMPEEKAHGTHARSRAGIEKKGIPRGVYQISEQLANNPEILESVIEMAKKREEIPTKTAVLGRIRSENFKKRNEDATVKSEKRVANEKMKAVKDYYDLIKGFKAGIQSAIISAKYGDFSADGKNFIIKKHNELKKLLQELEDLI